MPLGHSLTTTQETDLAAVLCWNDGFCGDRQKPQHGAHLGKARWKDWAIRDYALNGDFILVTNDASDFRRLYAAIDVHPGLVILLPNAVQETQVVLFREAVKKLKQCEDTVNKVMEVNISEGGYYAHYLWVPGCEAGGVSYP